MYLDGTINLILINCENQIEDLKKELETLPDGKLSISRSGKYYSWRIDRAGGGQQYLPRSEEDTARALAKKSILQARLHDLEAEAESCRRYLRYKNRSINAVEQQLLRSGPEFQRLIQDDFSDQNEQIKKWEDTPCESSGRFPEKLIIPTRKPGEMVRSKIESITAGQLFDLGIPYKYEKLLRLGDMTIAPDFTALDVRDMREIPVEVFGMMDNPEYVNIFVKKMNLYHSHGYIPGINMITLYESPNAPLGINNIRHAFEEFFFNNPPIYL